MQLALKWGMPLEYVKSLPEETIAEYKALNILKPFTDDAQAFREAFLCTLIYNQSARKKSQLKSVTDLFPYLSNDLPPELEDPIIAHAYNLYKEVCAQRNTKMFEPNILFLIDSTRETINNEMDKDDPDPYLITKLTEYMGVLNGEIQQN